jgi:hypothetical protein
MLSRVKPLATILAEGTNHEHGLRRSLGPWALTAMGIGADSLGYLSLDGLVAVSGRKRKEMCLGCLTGDYPIYARGARDVCNRGINPRHQ